MPTPAPKVDTKRRRIEAEVLRLADAELATGRLSALRIARAVGAGENTVRRILAEHRAEEWVLLRSQRMERKACSQCEEELPIGDFPPRSDRPGKVSAICWRCLVDWRRQYRHDHPGPIREASRRRRARRKGGRTDGYADAQVWYRDGGECCICGLEIDPELRSPDPMSLSIQHVHPLSKRGPDVLKNVACAHLRCNQEQRDRYDPPMRSWVVTPVPYPQARDALVEHHYLHRMPPVSYSYGAFDECDSLRAVVTFGSPTSRRTATSACDDPSKVIELNRLWVDDAAPFGVASWFLARALKMLPAKIVVSYADTSEVDPRYGTPHHGGVYRACNFRYAGSSRPAVDWRLPGSTRNVGRQVPGAEPYEVPSRNRYWTTTGGPAQRRLLARECRWATLVFTAADTRALVL